MNLADGQAIKVILSQSTCLALISLSVSLSLFLSALICYLLICLGTLLIADELDSIQSLHLLF